MKVIRTKNKTNETVRVLILILNQRDGENPMGRPPPG